VKAPKKVKTETQEKKEKKIIKEDIKIEAPKE
jgi:hypothetical protein